MAINKFFGIVEDFAIECTKLGVRKESQNNHILESITSTYPLIPKEISEEFNISVVKHPDIHGLSYTYTSEISLSSQFKKVLVELYPEKLI